MVRVRPRPCPRCRRNRWRTVIKTEAWRCRDCGFVRDSEGDRIYVSSG